MRVISLVPSATETLLAWDVAPIAVTRYCEQPHLRQVGGTKDPDLSAIIDLARDLVVLCEEENRHEDAEALRDAGLVLHVLRIASVPKVGPALEELADALGLARPSSSILPLARPIERSAFVPIWRRPWMSLSAGTYGSSVLEHLGVANAFATATDRYPTVTLESAAAFHPDLVLAPSEPYPFGERHIAELAVVAPVHLIDGQDLFWWGVRTPQALERLARALGV